MMHVFTYHNRCGRPIAGMFLGILCALFMTNSVHTEDLLIGFTDPNETVVITENQVVEGNIYIVNNGTLKVIDADLVVLEDIGVLGNSSLFISGGILRFIQVFSYYAEVDLSQVFVEDYCWTTWSFLDNSTITMTHCTNCGEFAPLGSGSITIEDSDSVLFLAWNSRSKFG